MMLRNAKNQTPGKALAVIDYAYRSVGQSVNQLVENLIKLKKN